MFDCLIANQDRHHENWGLIVGFGKKLRLGCKVKEEEAKNRLYTKDLNYTVEELKHHFMIEIQNS